MRREQAARLDLAELLGVAEEDELGLRPLGVVDQPGEGRGVDHPRLIDQEHRALRQAPRCPRAAARSSSASRLAMLVAGKPSERRTLAARQVGAAARSSIPACAQPSAAATMA